MSALADIYIKANTLRTLLETVEKKGEKGISITLSIDDQANEWDQNLSGYVSQSKEDRQEKKRKFYVGNGKVFWTDGKINTAKNSPKKENNQQGAEDESDNLPF